MTNAPLRTPTGSAISRPATATAADDAARKVAQAAHPDARPVPEQRMTLRRDDAGALVPVQLKAPTVAELARYFAELAAVPNCANLPVYASDGRACYPLEWMTTYSPSGYRDAVIVKPRPDCHLLPVPRFDGDTSPRQVELNAEADRVRAACGAFYF